MKKRSLFGLSLAAFTSVALAQLGGRFPGGSGGRRRGNGAGTGDQRDRGKGGELPKPQVNMLEVALFEFHEDLKLHQEQEMAWQAYADSVRALVADRERQQRRSPAAGPAAQMRRLS